jgi:hypothetical protein
MLSTFILLLVLLLVLANEFFVAAEFALVGVRRFYKGLSSPTARPSRPRSASTPRSPSRRSHSASWIRSSMN